MYNYDDIVRRCVFINAFVKNALNHFLTCKLFKGRIGFIDS